VDDLPTKEPRARFGELELDLESGELWCAGEPRPLRPLAARALQLLVAQRHRLVSHEELRQHLWGDSAVEWATGLHQLIRQVRRALGDDPRRPRCIETVPRRGYRWVAPVDRVEPASAGDLRSVAASRSRSVGMFVAGIVSLPVVLLLVCVVFAWLGR
jgi:DNA-binding winged helix-turn-helix (wHTH) protein